MEVNELMEHGGSGLKLPACSLGLWRGLYRDHLERWLAVFPTNQVRVEISEVSNATLDYTQAHNFLGVEPLSDLKLPYEAFHSAPFVTSSA